MSKREYNGPPIDMTEQYASERPVKGKTVAGTTEDDLNDETTEWVPDHIDEDDLSEGQRNAAIAYLSHPNRDEVTFGQLADGRDFSKATARRAVHKIFRDSRGMDDLHASNKLAVKIHAHHDGDETSIYSLADSYPVSRTVLGNTKRTYPDLIEQAKPVSKTELEQSVEKYLQSRPSKRRDYNGSSEQTKNDSDSKTQKDSSEKEWPNDFSRVQRWFIEKISENPSLTPAELEKQIPRQQDGQPEFSPSNYHVTVKTYAELLGKLISKKGSVDSPDELYQYLQDHIPVSALDLTKGTSASKQTVSETTVSKDNGETSADDVSALSERIDSLETRLSELENGSANSGGSIAEMLIQSLSDEQLGQILRGAMNDE